MVSPELRQLSSRRGEIVLSVIWTAMAGNQEDPEAYNQFPASISRVDERSHQTRLILAEVHKIDETDMERQVSTRKTKHVDALRSTCSGT